jgi:hypothetical protein
MRCGDRLIEFGESMADVRTFCGNPADVQHSVVVNATTARVGGSTQSTVGTEVPVETWTYNLGPNQLMVSIRFVDGKVVEVNTLHEYGH